MGSVLPLYQTSQVYHNWNMPLMDNLFRAPHIESKVTEIASIICGQEAQLGLGKLQGSKIKHIHCCMGRVPNALEFKCQGPCLQTARLIGHPKKRCSGASSNSWQKEHKMPLLVLVALLRKGIGRNLPNHHLQPMLNFQTPDFLPFLRGKTPCYLHPGLLIIKVRIFYRKKSLCF